MKLKKCIESADAVHIAWTDEVGGDELDLAASPAEKPLPSFEKALAALDSVAAAVLDLPKAWLKKTKARVEGVTVLYNKYEARSAKLHVRSTLKSGRVWCFVTPSVRIDEAAEGEQGVMLGADPEHCDAIASFIHEAEAYTDPENRSQQTFLQDLDPDPEQEGEQLDL